MEYIKKEKLLIQNKPNDDIIDKEITQGPGNYIIDNRIYHVSKNNYETELYQLFRLHLSYYLNYVPAGIKYKEKLEGLINNNKLAKRDKKIAIKKLLYQMSSSDLARMFNELLKKLNTALTNESSMVDMQARIEKTNGKKTVSDSLNDSLNDSLSETTTIEIIPKDFVMGERPEKSPVSSDTISTDFFNQASPPNTSYQFSKNEAPMVQNIHYPSGEKTWIRIFPENKKIDYPSFVIKNNRELCYNNSTKETCNAYQHCNWSNSKKMCFLSMKQDMLVNFINQVAEEFIQNELKTQEILRKGDYFVSDIVDYNVFTERPGERIIMSSNTNLNKILGEIFGKDHIPRIGKRRNKLDATQQYEQLNLANPMKLVNDWYVQNIIENNNTIFRAFTNVYYWLIHPYNEPPYRNLGYYSSFQTNLSNVYKSQIIDWLLSTNQKDSAESVNRAKQIDKLMPYVKYGKLNDFITKLSTDINTSTNCIIELYILSQLYETIIYVNDENYNIIYAFHPIDGFIYNYQNDALPFDTSTYYGYKKITNLRFHYTSKNISPDRIEAMYPK